MQRKVKNFGTTMFLALTGIGFIAVLQAADQTDNTSQNISPAVSPPSTPFPLQLEMQVPFAPTTYPGAGHNHLTYELHLTNFGTAPIDLRGLEVFDASAESSSPIAAFSAEQLVGLVQPVGQSFPEDSGDSVQLAGGSSAVVFLSLALDAQLNVPDTLRHRILTTDSILTGALVSTNHDELAILGPPLRGQNWQASGGPNNDEGHRRGILVYDGRAQISRRYAMDWVQVENGATHAGSELDNNSYYAYGEPVLAVADSTVVSVTDGIPENSPGRNRAVPMSLDTIPGNSITLDLGNGQYARYMHLQPGRVHVNVGDHVKRGQTLALVGNAGDSQAPHLHFEVTTEAFFLAGEGVPYVFDEFRIMSADSGPTGLRNRELPMPDENTLIDFGNRSAEFLTANFSTANLSTAKQPAAE